MNTSLYTNPFTQISTQEQVKPVLKFCKNPLQLMQNLLDYHQAKVRLKQNTSLYLNFIKSKGPNYIKKFRPESLQEEARSIIVGDRHIRTYYLAALPGYLYASNMLKLINLSIPMQLSYHIKGTNKAVMIKAARQRFSVLESEQNSKSKKGQSLAPETIKEMQEVQGFINDLVHDQERSYLTSVYAAIQADSRELLLDYHKKFQDATQDIELTFNTYSYAQKNAWLSTLPLCRDIINEKQLLQTSAVINLLPFLTRNLNDPSGIFLGINHYSNALILIDVFKARNANINIFGTSGSGKSVTAKLIMLRLALRGVQNIIIDPEGEYVELTKELGGRVFAFDNNNGIDPFILVSESGSEIANNIQVLKHFLTYFIQAKNQDSSILDKVLLQTFLNPGIINFAKFIWLLKDCIGEESGIYQDMQQLAYGSLSGLFNNHKELNYNGAFVCFDLSKLQTDEQKIPLMYIIGNLINRVIDKKELQTMIFIDEAHKMLHDEVTTSFYIDLVKTARKRKAGVVTITQNPEDFKESDNSKTIITQAETSILLKQSSASINFISRFELFRLTKRECTDLSTFNVGEALFIREKEHIFIDVFPFTSEQGLVFTNNNGHN